MDVTPGIARLALTAALTLVGSGCGWLCQLVGARQEDETAEARHPEPASQPEVATVRGRGTVVVHHDPDDPMVAVQIWAAHGSADDVAGANESAGLCAELFCQRISPPPGVAVRGWASPDATVCEIEAPAGLGVATTTHVARLLSELTHGVPDAEVAARCRAVEERWRASRAGPRRVLMEHLFKSIFDGHPYERPALDQPACDRIDSQTIEACSSWFASSPVVVAGAGPISADGLAHGLASGGWRPRHGVPPPPSAELDTREAPRVVVATGTGTTTHVAVSFAFPPGDVGTIAALELIGAALVRGPMSRLSRSPNARSGRLLAPDGTLFLGRRGGMLMLTAEAAARADTEDLSDAARGLVAVGLSLHTDPLVGSELERGRSLALMARARAFSSARGSALSLGLDAITTGDPGRGAKVRDILAVVTARDVLRAVHRCLTPERMTVAAVIPELREGDPEGMLPVETDPDGSRRLATHRIETMLARIVSEVSGAMVEGPGRAAGGPVARVRLEGGATVLLRHEPAASTVALRASCPVTSAWQSANAASELVLLAAMLANPAGEAGLRGRSARSSHDVLSVMAEVLPTDFEAGLASVVGELLRPGLSPDALEQARAALGTRALSLHDDPVHVAESALRDALFQGTPYEMVFPGSIQAIDATSLERLGSLHRRAVRPEELIVSIVGPVELERASRGVAVALASASSATGSGPAEPAWRWVRSAPAHQEIRLDVPGNGACVVAGSGTDGLSSDHWPRIEVLAALLDGADGPIGRRLGASGLARAVWVEARLDARAGLVQIVVETAPGNEGLVVEALGEAIAGLRGASFSADDLSWARGRAARSFAERLATPGERAEVLEAEVLAGLRPGALLDAGRRILDVQATDLERTAREVFADERVVMVVAGPVPARP
jgi:predicted Zn-dependent peptidase